MSRAVDILLVGGGVAAASCSVELRSRGFDGSVLLVGRELDPPYERPPISKGLLLGSSSKEDAFVPVGEGVEVLTRTSVTKLDLEARVATLSSKEEVSFGRALLATGANVRRLPIDGTELEGVHYLRALRNAATLREDVEGAERVALVGGSFIACEVAASLSKLGIASTLVFPEEEPLSLQFGATAGRWVRSLLEEHGVEVLSGETVARLEGDGGDVARLVCSSGRVVACDAVVIGVGAVPDVMLARSSGFELGAAGGVLCRSTLATVTSPDVFAAGDVCEYESPLHGRPVRIEHHEVAAAQGRCAARNLLGESEDFTEVPYFWSDLADWATLESVGPAVDGWDAEEVLGSIDEGTFSVRYRKEGRLVACMTRGRPEDLDAARAELAARATAR
ncbi:MAG: FAD-dependent oxidoreductase [Actinomycetota bacterium]|nr:FAD-dependent oxidoreductase [Actinomycetota bacterium]